MLNLITRHGATLINVIKALLIRVVSKFWNVFLNIILEHANDIYVGFETIIEINGDNVSQIVKYYYKSPDNQWAVGIFSEESRRDLIPIPLEIVPEYIRTGTFDVTSKLELLLKNG